MRYYELDHRRTRLREFVRLGYPNSLGAALIWFQLKLGLSGWQTQIIPREESLEEGLTTLENLPEPNRSYLTKANQELQALGFAAPNVQSFRSRGANGVDVVGSVLRAAHNSGSYVAQAIHSFQPGTQGAGNVQLVSFTSADETMATTNARKNLDLVPGAKASYHPGASVAELQNLHEYKLRDCKDRIKAIRNKEDLQREIGALATRFFDHMVRRGLMREIKAPSQ